MLLALMAGATALGAPRAKAASPIGRVASIDGTAFAKLTDIRRLQNAAEILLDDLVWTDKGARVALDLGKTRVSLGSATSLRIDRFIADRGGTLSMGDGAIVVDRDESLPKVDLQVRSAFGLIGVRGTRFFAGPSRGVFGVGVTRGSVSVRAGGVTRILNAGDGVDIAAPGGQPSPVRRWPQARFDEAFASVLG